MAVMPQTLHHDHTHQACPVPASHSSDTASV
jgi:hypothetical protein